MTVDIGTIVPRSQISLGLEPKLRGALANLANGRVLVIDYFASRRCSVVIGDLTGDFGDTPPGAGYVELASVESVRVFAESRLLAVLGAAGPTLRLGGPPFARHLSVVLDRPERWIDFLEGPGVLAGKRRGGRRRR
jgi:hypothetical protein